MLEHGYTNETALIGGVVTKTFAGDGPARREREELAVRSLAGMLPVPEIIDSSDLTLSTKFVEGKHGQELIDAGHGVAVLTALGTLLGQLQTIEPTFLPEFDGTGVLAHSDFGPNNVRLRDNEVVLLHDWEWAKRTRGVDPAFSRQIASWREL